MTAGLTENDDCDDGFEVTCCAVGDLSQPELAACIRIVIAGGAVSPESVKRDLPRSSAIAIARRDGQIVGVGTIKPVRPAYALGVGKKSGMSFRSEAPELGYVAVHGDHRRKGLSHRLLKTLPTGEHQMLFATTSSEAMKKTLAKAGFAQKGKSWSGRNGDQLSLWIRGS